VEVGTEEAVWKGVIAFIAATLLAFAKWVFGIATQQRALEAWRENVDEHIDECKSHSAQTHDVVLVLQTEVKHLAISVEDVKKGQKSILGKLTELVSRGG